jgi:uncharacterized protein (DUF885 family)
VGFKGDLDAFFKFLEEDPQFYFNSEDELLDAYRDVKRRIDALLPKLVRGFSEGGLRNPPGRAFRAASAAGASYQAPSPTASARASSTSTLTTCKAQPRFGSKRFRCTKRRPGITSRFRSSRSSPTCRASAASTATCRIRKAGRCMPSPSARNSACSPIRTSGTGRLSDEMLRAMRLVVDTGLHAKGWTREQAIRYMLDNSSMAESDVVAEVERYIVWPGQALGYKLGQLHISALRARAQSQLGNRFDVREFHSQILRDGAVPMNVLTAKIDRWVASKQRPVK